MVDAIPIRWGRAGRACPPPTRARPRIPTITETLGDAARKAAKFLIRRMGPCAERGELGIRELYTPQTGCERGRLRKSQWR